MDGLKVDSEASRPAAALDPASLRSIQNRISWSGRDAVARAMAGETAERMADTFTGGRDRDRLAQLRAIGHCPAPLEVAPRVCDEVRNFFQSTPCYAAHVPAQSDGVARRVDETADGWNYGSYTLEQSLRAPHLIELALHSSVLDLAGGYLGCAPSLYSINTFWTFPRPNSGLTHDYHRDEDDFRFVVVFIYWTDVGVNEGEFYFIEGSHDYATVQKRIRYSPWPLYHRLRGLHTARDAEELRRLNAGTGYGYDRLYRLLFGRHIRCIEGAAGTAIMSDTFGLHSGALPRSRRRLCTWMRYGLYENTTYRNDRTAPVAASVVRGRVPDGALNRHVTRLLLDWNQ